jgi:hypothetical protein
VRGIVIATVTQDGSLTVTDRVVTMGAETGMIVAQTVPRTAP